MDLPGNHAIDSDRYFLLRPHSGLNDLTCSLKLKRLML